MQKTRYFVIIVAIVILIIQLVIADFMNFWTLKNILHFLSPILLILAMVLSINHVKKHGEN